MGIYIRKNVKILRNSSKNYPNMVPNSWKIHLWSCLGALWAPSWRQDGPRATPKLKNVKKSSILGWPLGSKMEPKWVEKLIKHRLDFCIDFETTFSRYCVYFDSKNLSKIRVSGSLFLTLSRICEKCDLERPSHRFARFFDFWRVDFRS